MNNHNTKSEIVELIRQCDPKGYELLYENYSAILFGTIIRIVKDEAIAGELLKQAFEKIYKDIDQYRAERLKFLTWILQLARSVSIDYFCISKQKPVGGNFSGNRKTTVSVIGNSEMVMMQVMDEENEEIEVFNMILQGYKADEIAEHLNMDIETVKINIRKGMKLKARDI